MANADTPLIPRDGTLTIKDGAGSPLSWVVKYDGGDFAFQGVNAAFMNRVIFKNRGLVSSVRDIEMQEVPFTFTCDAVMMLGDGTTATIYDVLMFKGPWVAATSTLPSTRGDTKCLTLLWTGERSNLGGTADNTLTLKYCYFEFDFAEGVPGKFSIKGTMVPYSTDYWTAA